MVNFLQNTGINLGMHPANERRRYNVTTSVIGWARTLTDPWKYSQLTRVGVNSIPELELQLNSNSNSGIGIGIGIEIGGIENGIVI